MANHVFITHAVEDKKIAEFVCEGLERHGIRCWIAPRDVPYGANFEEAIVDGISGSSLVILILSTHSNNSPHVKREIQNACMEDAQKPILPFRVENIRLNKALQYYLSSTQWLDASTPPLESHLDSLVKHVRMYLPSQEVVDGPARTDRVETPPPPVETETLSRPPAESTTPEDPPLTPVETPTPDPRIVERVPFSELGQSSEPPNRRRWFIFAGAALALVMIVVAAVAYNSRQNNNPQSAAIVPSEASSPQNDQVSGGSNTSNNVNLSPGPPVNSNTATDPPKRPSPSPSPSRTRQPSEQIATSEDPTPTTSPSHTSSGGILNGKAISLPKPEYPPMARAAHAQGTVVVQVVVDENGDVVSATAVSGNPLLHAAAVHAAKQAKFAPTKLSGQPVKVSGLLQYNFLLPSPSPTP